MIDPDKETLKSIIALQRNQDFIKVMKWFNDSLMIQSIENNGSVGETTRVNQGRNLELQDFIDNVAGAEKLFETLNEPQKSVT